MRKLIFCFLFLSHLFLGAQETSLVNWVTLNQAEELMKSAPKKILVDVYTSWCGPCKMLSAQTFNNPEIAEFINKNYYAIKFNAEGKDSITFRGTTYKNLEYNPQSTGRNGTHDLAKAIAPVDGKIAYPTVVYMDEDFKIIAPVQGFMKPDAIEPILNYFQDNSYKTIAWEEYSKSFKTKLKSNN
jgi:thioredoxin-related protein